MQTKYIREPKSQDNLYILTESQLRDMEILVIFNERKSMGLRASEVISMLMSEYYLSDKSIQRIVYPPSK